MRFFYDVVIRLYQLILILLAPFDARASKFLSGRKRLFQELEKDFTNQSYAIIWIHAASLGEFEQARPIIDELKKSSSDQKILVTLFSPSGYQVVQGSSLVDFVHYLPLDKKGNAKRFLDLVNPKLSIFVKYDLWFHHLMELRNRKIPTLLVSATFRSSQFYFQPFGEFFLRAFEAFSYFFVQDSASAEILQKAGFNNVSIAGDTRFDRVLAVVESPLKLDKLQKSHSEIPLMILGSIWPSDMQMIKPMMVYFKGQVRFILAPHQVDSVSLKAFDSLNATYYSQSSNEDLAGAGWILLDTMGMLSSIYALADMALVGGASRGALHNVLEPAAHGLPVFFEQDVSNVKFKESAALVAAGGGFEYANSQDLIARVEELIIDESLRQSVGKNSRKFVEQNAGATTMVMSKIKELL